MKTGPSGEEDPSVAGLSVGFSTSSPCICCAGGGIVPSVLKVISWKLPYKRWPKWSKYLKIIAKHKTTISPNGKVMIR